MRKIAELLWQRLKSVQMVKRRLIRARERMRLLYPEGQTEAILDTYYVDTIVLLMKIILVGGCLFLAVLAYEEYQSRLEVESVERNEYGEGSKQLYLMGSNRDGLVATSRLQINERMYTTTEIQMLFEEAIDEVSNIMVGTNESLGWVETSLTLPTEIKEFPFSISWKSSDRNVISDAGVIQDNYREQEVGVSLKAVFQYEEFEESAEWEVTIAPSLWTEEQIWEWTVENSLQSAESESLNQKEWNLPNQVNGENVSWKIKSDNRHIYILIILILCILFVLWGRNFDIKRKLNQRKESLEGEYNAVVTRLVLYLGTGLPIKSAWNKTAEAVGSRYPDSIAAREMTLTSREMDSGFLEKDCYVNFGKRCGRQEYIRLGTLLAQNLKKGSGELLKRLREEVKISGEQQKHIVRKRGEEATTKLLLPMMLLLAMTMVLIMIPAFMGIG